MNGPENNGHDDRKRLAALHFWHAVMIAFLALSGLILYSEYWKALLGEIRLWVKWLHIIAGLLSAFMLFSNLRLAIRLWKHLQDKLWQRLNVITMCLLMICWLVSGILLWLYHAVGPAVTNAALLVHDVITWIGLPIIIYHSLTKFEHWRVMQRHQSKQGREDDSIIQQSGKSSLYTRKSFIYLVIFGGLAISVGPNLFHWMINLLSGQELHKTREYPANDLLPAPQPLPASSPPIGGGASGEFRIYTVTDIPSFNNHNWMFTIDGLVEEPAVWNWEQFVALPRTVQVSDFHCVTGWSVYQNTWEGIALKNLLEKARVKAPAKAVKLYSGDGLYTDSLSLEQAMQNDIMVALMHDGKPIPSEQGGPVRLIVPKMYAYKSVKWLNRIELIDTTNYSGYWEQRGYPSDAWVK
jgi:hypothetical protein